MNLLVMPGVTTIYQENESMRLRCDLHLFVDFLDLKLPRHLENVIAVNCHLRSCFDKKLACRILVHSEWSIIASRLPQHLENFIAVFCAVNEAVLIRSLPIASWAMRGL